MLRPAAPRGAHPGGGGSPPGPHEVAGQGRCEAVRGWRGTAATPRAGRHRCGPRTPAERPATSPRRSPTARVPFPVPRTLLPFLFAFLLACPLPGDRHAADVPTGRRDQHGALNTCVTKPGSALRSLSDLRGKNVSGSVGSASDGTLVRAPQRAGIDPEQGVHTLNPQPAVGVSALQSGSADVLSQFVAWPGLLTSARPPDGAG
ncbi:hypothetical protein JCM4914_08130 [Streptomyces platensis subsp. malvinus]